jgi:hypothetical protein
MSGDDDLAVVVERERQLLRERVLSTGGYLDPAEIERLLHPELVEFGASGRVWDRASILDLIAGPSWASSASPPSSTCHSTGTRGDQPPRRDGVPVLGHLRAPLTRWNHVRTVSSLATARPSCSLRRPPADS